MAFDIVSFLIGNMIGGDVFATLAVSFENGAIVSATDGNKTIKASTTNGFALLPVPTPSNGSQTWTVYSKLNGKTLSKSVLVDTYGARYEVFITNVDVLKDKAAATNDCRLSNAIGDGAVFKGRWFTRTTAEPVLFCGADGTPNASNNSYCVVSTSSTPPEHTHSSYGDLAYTNTITLQNGRTLYCHFMSGMWATDISTISWTVDGKSENLGNTTYIGCSGSLVTDVLSIIGTNATGFEEILNEYYDLAS